MECVLIWDRLNDTRIEGYLLAKVKTSIDTAKDFNQIAVKVVLKGTLFGVSLEETCYGC